MLEFDKTQYALAQKFIPNDRALRIAGVISASDVSEERLKIFSTKSKNDIFYTKAVRKFLLDKGITLQDFAAQISERIINNPHEQDWETFYAVTGLVAPTQSWTYYTDLRGAALHYLYGNSGMVTDNVSTQEYYSCIIRVLTSHYEPLVTKITEEETDINKKLFELFLRDYLGFLENERKAIRTFSTMMQPEEEYFVELYEVFPKVEPKWLRLLMQTELTPKDWLSWNEKDGIQKAWVEALMIEVS